MKILKKLLPIIGLLYFGLTCFGASPRGVSYDPGNTNVLQTVHQKFHSITNLAATESTIAGYDANKKLGTISASAARTILEVPIFDSIDPGAANIFPFWDDTGNEVDWTSSGGLRTLLGIDSNDAVTFGAVTGDSFVAGSTNMVGALASKQPLDTDLTALAAIAGVQGAIIYHNGTSWVKLDPGTSGHVLKTQGAGANPQWAAESGGGGGSAPTGTMVNSGASTQYALPRYSDTTGTNLGPSSLLTDVTGTNFYAGGFLINTLTVTNPIPVTSGGLGIASGTSGGVPYFNSGTTIASSGALAANAIVLGGGAGAAPSTTTTGSGVLTALGNTVNASGGIMTPNGTASVSGKSYSGAQTLEEGGRIALDPAGSADGAYSGVSVTGTAGYTQAFGDLVYLDPTDSRWEACDANSASGADGDSRGHVGMVVIAGTDGTACTILLHGIVRADAKFATFTVNNPLYISETAGAITQTQPITTDVVIRIIGAALTADEIYFRPDWTWTTHN